MGCPYFQIQKSEEFDNIAEIIGADKEAKHFVRRRRYTPFDVSDGSIKSALDKNIRHSQSGYFDGLRIFSIIFPLMVVISIYAMIAAEPENRMGLIAIPITTFGLGVIWCIFLICHVMEFNFVKSCDDLFIAYDGEGNPYSIEVCKKRIRVLYKDSLYVIKGNKIKTIRNERKLYYTYLNMFPQSVLDMGKYVDNSNREMEPILSPSIEYLPDGGCALSLGERGFVQISGKHGRVQKYPLLHHLHFCKYIFTVNNELKLTSVYSAARENAVISHDALTFAKVTESGNAAMDTLRKTAEANILLGKILNDIVG
ncbi:MAG: hypothetical protein HDT28_02045 [Clostridiales bacterium]|nr:hypothetical protein [Clostridiales bacterium]